MLKIIICQSTTVILLGFCGLFINRAPLESLEVYPDIIQSPISNCIAVSHTEGKGLGYSQGYTSLDLFLAKPVYENQVIPFANLRGHVFNKGRLASNIGLGFRWFNPCYNKAWGLNVFYDAFRTSRSYYNQIGFGFEMLSETWDVRINGYLPIGHKKTQIYKLSYDIVPSFLAKARDQLALGGVEAEVGYHFCKKMKWMDNMYVGLGPYVYWGRAQQTHNAFLAKHKEAVGGRLRASADFFTYGQLEGVTSYDSRFKWTGQVTLSLNIPFDWMCSFGKHDTCSPCGLSERLCQPVIRNEIIVVDRVNRTSSNPLILDPEFEP